MPANPEEIKSQVSAGRSAHNVVEDPENVSSDIEELPVDSQTVRSNISLRSGYFDAVSSDEKDCLFEVEVRDGVPSDLSSRSVTTTSLVRRRDSMLVSAISSKDRAVHSQTLFTALAIEKDSELIFSKRQHLSQRLKLGDKVEKPWLNNKSRKKLKVINYIMTLAFLCGCGIIAVQLYFAWKSITNLDYCEVLVDNFETFNTDVWNREVRVGGYGTGSFDWTTDSDRNSYVKDGRLYILPTLTNETISNDQINNGYTVNLTADGTCTSSGVGNCWITSNSTEGIIIPPVQSARINTKGTASIKYGKIEVRAKMPVGDWLWPAIWLMPVNDTYGTWPASGEIDIAESRGNGVHYPMGGYDTIVSTLHWGPTLATNAYYKTSKTYQRKLGMFGKTFHTFGLEWNEKYIKTYIDQRLVQVLYRKFNMPFWKFGDFSSTYSNGSVIFDPWPENNNIAPFDQEFYLIMNVAVGGTNGFFPDSMGKKPWVNAQQSVAPSSFWSALSSWLPSWPESPEDRAMVVESVKMYRICDKSETKTKRSFLSEARKMFVPF